LDGEAVPVLVDNLGGELRLGPTIDLGRHVIDGIHEYALNLPNRVIDFSGGRFGGLIRGEINALQGRKSEVVPEIRTGGQGVSQRGRRDTRHGETAEFHRPVQGEGRA
jgi:hypothetical protein